jgi:hypothetical protein
MERAGNEVQNNSSENLNRKDILEVTGNENVFWRNWL